MVIRDLRVFHRWIGSTTEYISRLPVPAPRPTCIMLDFTLFINSVRKVIRHSKFLLFADDSDCHLLQSDLNALNV